MLTALEGLRIVHEHVAITDREQQYTLVRKLAGEHLRGALGGTTFQASPPGYGLFALPFHLLVHPFTHGMVGYQVAGWVAFVLLGGAAVRLLRDLGVVARSPQELLGLAAVTGASTMTACVTESYHPVDILASALLLLAVSLLVRRRLGWAAVVLGAGLLTKQWVLPATAVLAVLHQGRARRTLAAVPLAIAVAVTLPFLAFDPGDTYRAWSAPSVVVTPRSWFFQPLQHAPDRLLAVEARILPLLGVALLCYWLDRQRRSNQWPTGEVLVSALTVALLIRPPLDPAGFAYYLAPGVALLSISRRPWPPLVVLAAGWVTTALLTMAMSNDHADFYDGPASATAIAGEVGAGLLVVGLLAWAVQRLRTLMLAEAAPSPSV